MGVKVCSRSDRIRKPSIRGINENCPPPALTNINLPCINENQPPLSRDAPFSEIILKILPVSVGDCYGGCGRKKHGDADQTNTFRAGFRPDCQEGPPAANRPPTSVHRFKRAVPQFRPGTNGNKTPSPSTLVEVRSQEDPMNHVAIRICRKKNGNGSPGRLL
jgi:hypothetical protein